MGLVFLERRPDGIYLVTGIQELVSRIVMTGKPPAFQDTGDLFSNQGLHLHPVSQFEYKEMAGLSIRDRTIVGLRIPFAFSVIQNLVVADIVTRREIPLAIGNAPQQRVIRGVLLAHGGIRVFRQADKLLNGQPINGFSVLFKNRTPPLFDSLYTTISNILLVDSIPHVLCQFFSDRIVRLKFHAGLVSDELAVGQVIFLTPRQLQVLVCS